MNFINNKNKNGNGEFIIIRKSMQRSQSRKSFQNRSLSEKYLDGHRNQMIRGSNRLYGGGTQILLSKVQQTIQEASQTLTHSEFTLFYSEIISALLKRIDSESIDSPTLEALENLVSKYSVDIELSVKLMILKAKMTINIFPQEALNILNKIKHIIINSPFQYMFSRLFILEAKALQGQNRKDLQAKSLLKSIEFAENFILQYLNQKQQIRKQITENIIIAYFELYKIKKQSSHKQAEEFIKKACRTCEKTYGQESKVAQLLNMVYNDHKNIGKGLNKVDLSKKQSQKAITEIIRQQIKKDLFLYGFYCWQDEKLQAQLIKNKLDQEKIISETQYEIRLDINKINQLKNKEWLKIQNAQVYILEEELLKVTGIKNDHTLTTKIGIKTISRDDIIKKDNFSSSSEDPSFIQKEDFNFIRKLGRSQSAKRQTNR